jgi:hypothetical protein
MMQGRVNQNCEATLSIVVKNGEEGCVLEIFNAIGESLTEIAVPISAIETLRSDEILAVRTLAKVS